LSIDSILLGSILSILNGITNILELKRSTRIKVLILQ